MPKTQICSHSSMARIMVNQPVLRKEPDFILQSIVVTLEWVALCWWPSHTMGTQCGDRWYVMGLLRSQQYLFFPVSFWKISSQYVIFSSVRV